jgi:LysR family hydrogen peroxide-inducible transcriptional activator
MPPHVTFKQLRYFDALAREQHFGRAAGSCSVTQPALSMQIHELEEQLGLVLVERTRAGVLLSDKGREVAARAARILTDVREMVEFAQHANDLLSGSLRLGVIPSIAPYMLPPLLPLLRESYPDLELHARRRRCLSRTSSDRAARRSPAALPILTPRSRRAALRRPLPAGLPMARRLSARVRRDQGLDRARAPLLLEEGHRLRDQALTYRNLQQVSTVNTFGVSSLSTIVEMVAAGYGITLLPEMCLNVEARAREIGLTRFVEPEPHRIVGLAWRATSPRVADFRELGRLIKVAWSRGCVPPGRKNPRHKRPLSASSS